MENTAGKKRKDTETTRGIRFGGIKGKIVDGGQYVCVG